MIQNGQKVSLEYTVFLEDGTKIDSNIGDNPLIFVLGSHDVFPALEDQILGLKIGDSKKFQLQPEQAYGHILREAFREVDIDNIPAQYRKEGAILTIQDQAGGVYPIRVHQVRGDMVILDFNHPLAGKRLLFEVKVLDAA